MITTRKIIMLILIAFIFLPMYAQELKTKKILTGNYLEIFTVDKKSKMRNGEYLKIDRKTSDTLISGTFKDDLKTGLWKYNGKESKPWLVYDYDKKILSPILDQILKVDSFLIRKDDAFMMEKVDSPPLYIGYKDEIRNIMASDFKIPVDIVINGLSGNSVASFIVDKNGKMGNFRMEKMETKEVSTNMFSAYKKIEGEWLPAVFNGQPVDSKIFIVFDIRPMGASSTTTKIINSIAIEFTYFGVKRAPIEITTTTRPYTSFPRR